MGKEKIIVAKQGPLSFGYTEIFLLGVVFYKVAGRWLRAMVQEDKPILAIVLVDISIISAYFLDLAM